MRAQAPPAEGLVIRGFISATMFAQDQNFSFGNGQNAEWPIPPEYTRDRWFYGGDVRNTRLTFAFNGPKVAPASDWRVGAVLEADFFGGFNGTGAFSGQQPTPRLRLAYADIGNGRTTLRIGQFWSPLFGFSANAATNVLPVSTSHIAFPLGYGSGLPGWRFPGIFLYQALTPKTSPMNAELQLAVMRGSWDRCFGGTSNGECSTGTNSNINELSAGNAGFPQVEARLNLGGKAGKGTWGIYAVGHWDQKDLSGANASLGNDKLDGKIGELGARLQVDGFLIQGSVYNNLIKPGGGSDIVIAGPNNNEIQDKIANLDGIRVRNFHSGDILNFTNLDPNGTTAQYDAATGVLSVFRYSHQVATILLPGLNANTQFLVTPNGGGANITLLD